jgi:hypothetical protein
MLAAVSDKRLTLQLWIRSTDVHHMLLNIGGWGVDSVCHREAREAVEYAIERGWVSYRMHHPLHGEPWRAFELTDLGLERVRGVYGPDVYEGAKTMRQWYRDRVPGMELLCEDRDW